MNKIYKVIWNKTLNCWNVTSELGKTHGKAASQVEQSAVESNPFSHFFFRLKVSVLAIMAALLPMGAFATVAIDSNYGDYAINTGTAQVGNEGGDRALNYSNPGNQSYADPNNERVGSNLYSPDIAAGAIAIGRSSDARTALGITSSGIAIGDYSRAVGGLALSFGQYSQATNIGSTAIGTGALASGFNALSIMRQSAATNDYAMAIGNVSYAKGKGSLAMGQSSTALGNQSIAIGSADVSPTNSGSDAVQMTRYDGTTNTQASADFAVAIGAQSKALEESAVALGTKAKASGLNSTAIGTESSANEKSAALGYQAKADGKEATAIGATSSAAGEKSLALGMNANASKNGAFAIGADSNVSAENAGAIGQNTKVAQQNTIAIGNNITSTQANSIVIGSGSTDRAATTENGITLNGTTYTYAGQSAAANGVVSVASAGKERQIINVGAGKVSGDSTDAINGSQLYAVTQELTHFYSVNSKDTTAGNYNNKGATGVNALAAGVGASATQKNAVAVGGNAKGHGELSVAVGSALAQSSHAVAIGSAASTGSSADSAIAMGHSAKADKDYTVAIGSSANALQDSSVAIGSSAGARGNQAVALGANSSVTGVNGLGVGFNAAASGANATAISANATAGGASATAISANAKANTIGDVALGANAVATGRSTSTTISAGAARGETLGSAIAVGSIAKAEGRNALAIGNNAQALGSTADASINDTIAIGANSSVFANRGTALGYKATVSAAARNSVAIGTDAKSFSNNAVAIGSGAVVGSTTGSNTSGISIGAGAGSNYISGTESVAIGNQSGQYVDGNTNYAFGSRAGNIVKGADNYAQGIEAGQVVSGLGNTAIGYASGRYVNGNHNQSYGYGDKNSGQNINGDDNISLGTMSGRNIGAMTSSVTASKATFTSTTKSDRNIAIGYESNNFEANAPLLTSDNLAMGTRTIASGGSAMALGAGAQATGANSLALGVSNVANTADNTAGAVSNNTKASGENAIAIGHGAQASAKDTISIGTGNVVSGQGSSAVGDPSIVAGSNSFSAGNNNAIGNSTDNAFIFGGRNNLGGTATTRDANGVISTAGGISNAVNASKSAIVGYNNSVQDQNVFVVGNNVEVKNGMTGAVVLGNDSTADAYVQTTNATVGDVEFGTFAGSGTLTPGAIVSVGKSGAERQIKNVAAGQISSTSTDAINGSQLYAVANKPMTFAGDSGTNVERKLGETLTIKGGKTDGLTENNIGVVADNDKNTLTVKLAETINLGEKGSVQTGDTKIDNGGLTITNGPSVTNAGINAGGTTISNVGDAKNGTDAVNKNQLDTVEKIAESKLADFTVLANSDQVKTVSKDDNSIAFIDGTNIKVTNDNGKVKIATADDVTFNTVTVNNSGDVKQGDNKVVTGDTVFKALDGLSKTVVAAGNNVSVSDPQTSDDGKTTTYTVNAEKTTVSAKTDGGLTVNAGDKGANDVTNYEVALSDKSKASLDKADTALQSWTAQVNGTDAKEVKSGNNKVNFVDGDNIAITNDAAGNIKVSTTKAATFDTVTINNGGNVTEGSKSAVNGGDVYTAIQNTESQFKGDNTNVTVKRKPSQALSITGGATGEATSGNIKTVADANGSIAIQLAKQLTGLSSISAESIKLGDTVEISKNGINAGGTTISNVASGGTIESNAANIGDVQKAAAAAKTEVKAGTNVTDVAKTKGEDDQAIYTVNANGSSVSAESALKVTAGEKDDKNITDYKIDLAQTTKDDIKKGVDAAKDIADKGLTFTADGTEKSGIKKLGNEVAITGDKNITTKANENGVQVTLNSDLTGLNSITTTGGVTINEKGIDAGSKTITNVAKGEKGTDAVNKDQLDAVAKNITGNAKTTSVVSGKNTTVSSKVDGVNTEYTVNAEKTTVSAAADSGLSAVGAKNAETDVTDYAIGLSQGTKDSLDKADTALQSWTAKVNDTEAKVVNKDDANVNFVNGDNIAITNDAVGNIKVSTTKAATFDTVTINNGGSVTEGSKSAVNGGDVYTAIQNTESQFTGDNNTVIVKRKPSDVLSITGGATGDTTSGNIKTVADTNGSIAIQLAKQLTGLSSISAESIKLGDKVEISKGGINAGGTTISNVADGVDGKDAVNKDQLDKLKDQIAAGEKSAVVAAGKNTTVEKSVDGNVTTYTVNAEKTTVSEGNGVKVATGTKDANGVTNYEVSLDNDLVVGDDKNPGSITIKGENGKDGVTLNGKDGTIGLNGKDGSTTTVGVINGKPGLNGKDGEMQPRLTVGDKQVATLEDGLKFQGDKGDVIAKQLNETLTIKGNADKDAEVTDKNLRVDNEDGNLIVKMAKELKELTSATFGNTVINNDGVTVNNTAEPAKTVSLTKDGLNNGGNQIKNVASGLGDTALADAKGDTLTNAANIGDVKNAVDNAVDTASKDAFGLTDDNDGVVKQDLGKQIKVKGDGSITTKVNADEKALELALAKDITVGDNQNPGSITIKGENGKDAIALNGKDGTIGLNGKDGSTTTVGVTNGKPGLNGKDGETQPRLTIDDKQVATLEDGLKFQGDKGDVIAKQLNETLTIKGNADKDAEVTDKNLRVDNEDGNLIVKMAKELKELTSATFGNTVINNDGVTVNNTVEPAKTVSLTKDGLNNGGNQIKNVASGLGDTALADAKGDTLTNAANIGDVQNAAAAARTAVKAGTNVASVVAEAGDKGQTIYTVNANGSTVTAGSELISVNSEKGAASNITDYKIDLSDKAKQSITAAKTEVKVADGESNLTVTPKTGANGQAIYEVALSKDLAVDSLQAGATKIDGNGLTVGDVAVTADGIRAGDNKITDVAAGTVNADSKDAVNGGQLFNQGEGVKNIIGGNTVYNPETGSYTNNNIGGTGKDNIDDAIKAANDKATQASKGWNLSVNNGVNKGNIAPDASVDLNNSDNNIVISKNGNNVTFDLNKDLVVSNLTADDSIKVGDVAVTKDGINAGNTVISNIQAAEVKQGGSDAATTGQLYNNGKSVADALGGGAAVDSNGNITAPSYTITQTDGSTVTANSVGGALNYFNREVVKPITFTADSGTHDAKLGTTVNVKGDDKNISTAMSGNTLTISMTDTPEFTTVTTGNTVMNSNGITVKGGNGTVSLTANGLDNGGNRITNVAPGVEGTDAVNVNQLNAVSGNLNKRIDSVDKHARGGIAGALATAGLYQAYLPGHSMVAVGAGTYRGENALAIGVSRISDNGKIGVKLSGMSTSQGDVGGSVSVGYQW